MFELILWGVVLAILIIAELSTAQMVSIWFAVGAIGAFIAALFSIPLIWQFTIFTLLSILLLIFTRPIFSKTVKDYTPTNSELDIGKTAVIIEDVDNLKGTGRATLNGVDWIAVSKNNETIPEGSIVIVEDIQGSKLLVSIK
ncbi:MAG: NfeD family protein [Clostridiales bacterium]|nr:NfeD family protein [Clostridiales bacterium]